MGHVELDNKVSSYCGQFSRRLITENEHLQEKSTLTENTSGGDPLTVKSERRLDNSRKESGKLSERERMRTRESESKGFEGTSPQYCCLPHFIVERGVVPSLMVQTTGEVVKSSEAVRFAADCQVTVSCQITGINLCS